MFSKYIKSHNRIVTSVIQYKRHICFQSASSAVNMSRKTYFSYFAVKSIRYLHRNGHSLNLQYFRQSRPINDARQRYNMTEKKTQTKSTIGHVRSNPFLMAFRYVDARLLWTYTTLRYQVFFIKATHLIMIHKTEYFSVGYRMHLSPSRNHAG